MIHELLFVLKCFVASVLILVGMQMHWGEQTVETRFENWMRGSNVAQFMKKASEGGGILIRKTYHRIDSAIRGTASVEKAERDSEELSAETRHHRTEVSRSDD